MNQGIIDKIRGIMKGREVEGYLLKNSDFHNSEYISEYYKVIKQIIGFGGSAGELLITEKNIVFWTDSRYDSQIRSKLQGQNIEIITIGKEDSVGKEQWIERNMKKGATIALDGRTYSSLEGEQLETTLKDKGYILKYDLDIVSEFLKERPELSSEKAFLLGVEYAGENTKDKLDRIRKIMKEEASDILVVQSLGEIAWILNIRGRDIKNNPFVTSNLLVDMERAHLYVDTKKITEEVESELNQNNIFIKEYNDFYKDIKEIKDTKDIIKEDKKSDILVLVDNNKINFILKKCILENKNLKVKERENIVSLLTSVKNSIEIENIKKAYLKDGVAVTKFAYWLKTEIEKGKISEREVSDKMDSLRGELKNFFEPSFDTISAYMSNAAMPHYSYKESSETFLEKKGLYLCDSGGQYLEGTTDITRMYVLGELEPEVKRDYTLVLKGMIAISNAKFLHGTTGTHVDYLARKDMWEYGINFNHGVGHGIGYFAGVHEGPYGISPRVSKYPLVPGVVVTNEPGIYINGSHGIRIENTLFIKNYLENSFGKFYEFETLTVAPIDIDGVDFEMLTVAECKWLKNYNELVYDKLSPYLDEETREWLKSQITI